MTKTYKQLVEEVKKVVTSNRWSTGIDDIGPGGGHHIAHANHKIYWHPKENVYHGYTDGKLVAKSDPSHKGASGRANLAKKLQGDTSSNEKPKRTKKIRPMI